MLEHKSNPSATFASEPKHLSSKHLIVRKPESFMSTEDDNSNAATSSGSRKASPISNKSDLSQPTCS